ncbi:MAG TPA: pyrroloquinoline quinone biosynthesis peptide chaperone PqqD [Roseovarius sp.]|nr:pyrroloquinoline quinone biosynthesis peptide chaperone PqqD [Roseovarius sp.]
MSLALAPEERPYLPRGVRLHDDTIRGSMVLLAPEKAVELDQIGVAILSRVNGDASFAEIIADLAQTYNAPAEQIEEDVQRFLTGLRARLYLMVQL